MSLSRSLVVAMSLSLVACGGTMPAGDASTPTGDASMTPADGSMMMMPSDGGGMMMTTDGGGSGNTGTCGAMTLTCMCACGNNAQCQNQCINANMACSQCVIGAQLGCCPTEAQALQTCLQGATMASDAGPGCAMNDAMCLAARCGTQVMGLNSCFQMAQQSNMACQGMLRGCFGNFPITCN